MVEKFKTDLDGVTLLRMDDLFRDHRGTYSEIFSKKDYKKCGIEVDFLSHTYSRSKRGVLRGLHGDNRTWKLVSCLYGEFYLVVLNFDQASYQFGKWQGFTISEENRLQVLVPPNFANGHYVTSDVAIFHYLQSAYYTGAGCQFTIRWNDPKFNIMWPMVGRPIISKRDREVLDVE